MTADHLCMICLNTVDHYRSPNTNPSHNPNLNHSSAVICGVQADRGTPALPHFSLPILIQFDVEWWRIQHVPRGVLLWFFRTFELADKLLFFAGLKQQFSSHFVFLLYTCSDTCCFCFMPCLMASSVLLTGVFFHRVSLCLGGPIVHPLTCSAVFCHFFQSISIYSVQTTTEYEV